METERNVLPEMSMIPILASRICRGLILLSALGTSVPASAEAISFAGGDGSSMERAVVILGAATEVEGIRAEHVWQAKAHPRWMWTGDTGLFQRDGRRFDMIELTAPDGSHKLWFDITSFFGKT